MKKYEEYINESISNVNKEYTDKIYNLFVDKGYGEYKINLSNKRLPLHKVTIIFENNKREKRCYVDDTNKLIEEFFGVMALNNMVLYFSNFELIELKECISHEINHIQETYDKLIKNRPKSIHDIINHTIQQIRDKNKEFDVFCDIIYNTTDNELNSKLNEIYYKLKSFKTENKVILKSELYNCSSVKKIKEIENLDFKSLSYGIINKISVIKTCDLINKFNKLYTEELKIQKIRNIKTYNFLSYKVFTSDDIIDYFLKWEIIIKNKFEKWFNKVDFMIEKTITDTKFNETAFLNINRDDNLIERLKNILKCF